MFVETLFLLSSANAQCTNCTVATAAAVPVLVSPLNIVAASVPKGEVEIEYKRNIFGKLVPVRAVQKLPKAKPVKSSKSAGTCDKCK